MGSSDSSIPDLWPKEIGTGADAIVPPVVILRAQASALSKRTNGILEGAVEARTTDDQQFVHSLYIVAPALGGYRYLVMHVFHDILLYPVNVRFVIRDEVYAAKDPRQFQELLRTLFAAPVTLRAIDALLAQSRQAK